MAFQKSNTKLNLFSTPKFITASGNEGCRESKAVNNRKTSETELLCMPFLCHLTYTLYIFYSCHWVSPALLILWMLNFWMETFRNRRWVGVCPPQIQKLMLSGWTYQWNWTYWTPACIYLSFSTALGKILQAITKNSLHATTLLSTSIHPQNVYSLCYCALTINCLEISKEVGKHQHL